MKLIKIPGLNFSCSKFIFGTASLFNAGSSSARRDLLEAAVDHGFTHFDTAPLYGFGTAERDLAGVLKDYPHISVTTKVGLYPPGGADQAAPSVFLRKAAGQLLKPLRRPIASFDLNRARLSLEGSLRRLGRDHIELYLLHDPALDLLDAGEWISWLQTRIAAGQIGQFGIALSSEMLEPFLRKGSALSDVVQTSDSLDRREADVLTRYARPLQITYGYVSAAHRTGDPFDAEDSLRLALARNRDGAIVVSTTRSARLALYRRLLEDAS